METTEKHYLNTKLTYLRFTENKFHGGAFGLFFAWSFEAFLDEFVNTFVSASDPVYSSSSKSGPAFSGQNGSMSSQPAISSTTSVLAMSVGARGVGCLFLGFTVSHVPSFWWSLDVSSISVSLSSGSLTCPFSNLPPHLPLPPWKNLPFPLPLITLPLLA